MSHGRTESMDILGDAAGRLNRDVLDLLDGGGGGLGPAPPAPALGGSAPERELAGPRFAADADASAAPSSADLMLRPMDLGGALWGADPYRPLGGLGLYGPGGASSGYAPSLAAGASVLDGWAAGLSPAPGAQLGGGSHGGGIGALWPGAGGPLQQQTLARGPSLQGGVGGVGGVGGGSALDGWHGLLHAGGGGGGGAADGGAAATSVAGGAAAPSDFAVALVNSAAAAKAAEMGLAPVAPPPPAGGLVYAHLPPSAGGGAAREAAESSGGAFGLGNFSLFGRPFGRASFGQDELLSPPPLKARADDGGGGGGGGGSGMGEWLAAQLGLARAPLGVVQPPASPSPRE
jgi:hypothetical protein